MGVFYRHQTFVLFLGQQGTVVRLKSVIDNRLTSNCFYLTEACELHIAAKTRQKKAGITTGNAVEPEIEEEKQTLALGKFLLLDDKQDSHGIINIC